MMMGKNAGNGKVTTICYGRVREYDSWEDAMRTYENSYHWARNISARDEALRYANVFFDLYARRPVAWDGEGDEIPDMDDELFKQFIECHPWLAEDEDEEDE